MRFVKDFFRKGNVIPALLVASALIAFTSIFGMVFLPGSGFDAEIGIEPLQRSVIVGDTFSVQIVVKASVPVNVFAGELHFNPDILQIKSIDYNTSIADLWAELPWYSNGEGTLKFGGGTTRPGGFEGTGTLINVTFKTLTTGRGEVSLFEPHIFLHDGLGTDARLAEQKDAIFFVKRPDESGVLQPTTQSEVVVVPQPPSIDLNNDGKQSITDISIFMLHIAGNDSSYDFNLDGKVDLKDLNILIGG